MTSIQPRIPERQKRAGLCYATTTQGIELPVVDLTHPAFALDASDAGIAAQVEAFGVQLRQRERMPRWLGDLLVAVALRGSRLARGLRQARGGFLAGIDTYLFKLGPDLLGEGYARPIDRKIAASLPAYGMRLRLLDVARLLAEHLAGALEAKAGPVHLLDIGGGPCADGWNALLLLRRDRPDLLAGRAVRIHALDLDASGAAFGARAVAALAAPGAPLAELDLALEYVPFDWSKPFDLKSFAGTLAREGVLAASSEGALFDYGSDAEIGGVLAALRAAAPELALAASVGRDDGVAAKIDANSRIALRPRSAAALRALLEAASWKQLRCIERPTSRQVLIAPG